MGLSFVRLPSDLTAEDRKRLSLEMRRANKGSWQLGIAAAVAAAGALAGVCVEPRGGLLQNGVVWIGLIAAALIALPAIRRNAMRACLSYAICPRCGGDIRSCGHHFEHLSQDLPTPAEPLNRGSKYETPSTMNNPRVLKHICAALALALMISLGALAFFCVYYRMQIFLWQSETGAEAYLNGCTFASEDFRSGRLRLYVISGDRDQDVDSGKKEGPFEIWYHQYFSSPSPMSYSIEQTVRGYNDRMRNMQKHPEDFGRHAEGENK